MTFTLHQGDCLDVLRGMADNSVDSIVTDPPYGLNFMGKRWDYDVPSVEVWAECMRVLKPGGYLLSFGGTRTYHRLATRIEDAGFTLHPMMGWLFGSGFPKATRVDVEGMEGWRYGLQSLKPAFEPICFAQKPFSEATGTANIERWGTGALNIDGCRVATEEVLREGSGGIPCRHDEKTARGRLGEASSDQGYAEAGSTNFAMKHGPRGGDAMGRWPANLIHDGSDEVIALFPVTASGTGAVKRASSSDADGNTGTAFGAESRPAGTPMICHGDAGSAARFFKECKFSEGDQWPHPSNSDQPAKSASNPSSSCATSTAAEAVETKTSDSRTEESPAIQACTGSCGNCTLCLSPASAAHLESTDTTRTTASHSKSNGCAHHATEENIKAAKWAAAVEDNVLVKGTRFHYYPKASKEDRNEGCSGLPERTGGMVSNTSGQHITRRDGGAPGPRANHHPTVKPTALMRYLVRLVTPVGGIVLDHYMGSGSTGKAAVLEGFDFVGIERDEDENGKPLGYMDIARARIEHAARQPVQHSFDLESA